MKFFLTRIEDLRTEDAVCCTDCKACCVNVILIFGYINKIDLIEVYSVEGNRVLG